MKLQVKVVRSIGLMQLMRYIHTRYTVIMGIHLRAAGTKCKLNQ